MRATETGELTLTCKKFTFLLRSTFPGFDGIVSFGRVYLLHMLLQILKG